MRIPTENNNFTFYSGLTYTKEFFLARGGGGGLYLLVASVRIICETGQKKDLYIYNAS